jgi:hypothetical protein
MPRTLGPGLWVAIGWSVGFSTVLPRLFRGLAEHSLTRGCCRSNISDDPESASRDAFLSSLPGSLQAPLMGFPKIAPPSVSALDVHSCSVPPRLSPRFRLASARSRQGAGPVPPSWFPTTLTVSSVVRLAGLLHPAADPGVRRVAVSLARVPRHLRVCDLPRRSTLRSLSTPAAVRRVSTVLPDACPPAVHRFFFLFRVKPARLQGFSPRDGFTGSPSAFRPPVPYNFLGFLLLSRFVFPRSFRPLPKETVDRGIRISRTRWGKPHRIRRSGFLPAPPPHGVGTLAYFSIEDRLCWGRSLSSISPGPPRAG